MPSDFSNWDFYNYHVQQDLQGGQFVSAESTLVGAGAPTISGPAGQVGSVATAEVFPIGLLETVGVQQSRQLQRIFEIGSSRSYFVPGRTIGSISIGRTFYFGPSLLRVLYAYYKDKGTGIGQTGPATIVVDGMTIPNPAVPLINVADESTLHTLHRTPGEGYFFIDLASDLFAQPTGMAIYFKDANATTLGAIYLENCYVQGHQLNISSGSVLVMEGASLQYDRIVPVKMLV